jgi:hypothetical protein
MGIILSGPTVLLPSAGSVTAASMAAAGAAADDAADVSAALAAPVVDPLTGAGWTAGTPSGGAAATWTSGTRLRVAVPTGVEGAAWVQRDDLLPDGPEWDFYTRVDIVAGDTAGNTRIILGAGVDENNFISAALWADGTLEIGRVLAGSYGGSAYGAAPGLDSAARTGGQLWLRLALRLGEVTISWGVGAAGVPPKGWRVEQRLTSADALAVAGGRWGRLYVTAISGGVVGGLTVDFLAIRTRASVPL